MKKVNFIVYMILSFLAGFILGCLLISVPRVQAHACKVLHANCVNASDHSCCAGLACIHGQGGYKCRTVASPTPTARPTPTATPTSTPKETVEPTPTPEETIEPTPEATPQERIFEPVPLTVAGPPQIPSCSTIVYAPTILGWTRLSSTSVKIWWSKVDSFVSHYVVFYGLTEGNLEWNTGVVEGTEIIISNLPKGLPIWVSVRGSDNGCLGPGSVTLDP